jgi:hypothetical protein
MAKNVQSGSTSFSGSSSGDLLVTSYSASNAWLRYSMRCDGDDNSWDDQVVAKKIDSTHIRFERRGNTGTVYIQWQLDEDDDYDVTDTVDTGPLDSSTYEDYSVGPVDLDRTFVDVSARQSEIPRTNISWPRARLTSTTNVRVELGDSTDADFEFAIQVVELKPSAQATVQEVLVSNSTGDEDISITAVPPERTFIVSSAYFDDPDDWTNVRLHSVRLNTAGTEVEMRRTDQTGDYVDAVVYVVTGLKFSVQRSGISVSGTSNSASFTAPGDTGSVVIVGGAYVNQSQFTCTAGGPDSSGHTLTPNGGYTSITAERAISDGTASVEVEMVEMVLPPDAASFGGWL